MFDNVCKCSQIAVRNTRQCGCGCGGNTQRQDCAPCLEPFFCPRLNRVVLRGPRGLPGPRGPQGLPGISSINNFASFVSNTPQEVEDNASVDFGNPTIWVGNAISSQQRIAELTLSPGTYFIVANMAGKSIGDFTIDFKLQIGLNEQDFLHQPSISPNTQFALGANTIILVSETSSFSVVNNSNSAVCVENISLSIIKIV